MSIDICCNGNYIKYESIPFYKDVVIIKTDLECILDVNKILIYCVNPRMNIDCLLYCSDFKFGDTINENTYGQIISKMLVNYHYTTKCDFIDFNILTTGYTITSIIINMPKQDKTFLRELLYLKFPKIKNMCYICYEEKNNIINLHYNHQFCLDCILQLKTNICPMCREKII